MGRYHEHYHTIFLITFGLFYITSYTVCIIIRTMSVVSVDSEGSSAVNEENIESKQDDHLDLEHEISSSMSSSSEEEEEVQEQLQEVDEGVQQQLQVGEEQSMEVNEEEDDGEIFTTTDNAADEEEQEGMAERMVESDKNEDEEEEDIREHDQQNEAHVMERMELSDNEEEEVVDTGPKKIELDVSRCKTDLGDERPYFVKLPNFLSIDTKPFDPETYDDELEEDEALDDEGKTRLKLKLENTIRWRVTHDEQGVESQESNARVVRWSDGSMSLYLGNEIFEMDKQRIMDFNHLYIRQGSALQAQSIFGEKLIFRPHSTETLTHRKMTMNMAEKTNKAQKVRILANVGDNPDTQKKELIRMEEEKLRAVARREAQQRRVRERPRTTGLTPGFLEGYESDEGTESIAAIKRRYQHSPYGAGDRDQSLSDSDEEREERQRKNINEAKIDSEDEEAETSDVEETQKSTSQQQQKKKIVIEDDED